MERGRHELPIPGAAADDRMAVELLRVWASGGNQHVSINTDLWEDPASWGIMLVDLAKHVANAYAQSGAADPTSALTRLRQGFDAEWEYPTDTPTGSIE